MRTRTFPILLLATVCLVFRANAVYTDAIIDWVGDGGYSARLSLTYDDSFASVSAAGRRRDGPAHSGISQLSVQFFNPAHQPLFSTANIANDVIVYDWLSFGFDTSARTLTGFIDVGKDDFNAGDLYLLAGFGSPSLIDVPTGTPVDSGGLFTVTIIPEPATFSVLMAGIAGFLFFKAARRST